MSAVLADIAATDARTWELKPLAEVADILDGKRVPVNAKEREKRQGPVPYYGATGQVGWIDDFLFDEELVLLGEDGAPFLETNKPKAYIIRGKSWVNNHAHVLRARAVPIAWLAHYLNVVRYDRLVTGTTRLKLTQAAMRQIRVPVAPWHVMEQRVADLEKQFSRLDEAVATLKRVKANLERQAAAILSAAIGGELIDRAVLPANTERPEFAPAIELPSGWSWASAAEVCEVVASGSTPKPEEMTSGAGEVPFIKVYNLGFDGSLDFNVKPTFIRRAIHDGQLARSRCLPGDVLMNIVGPPLGKVSLVPDSFPEWNINQAIVTFRVGPRILNHLLAYWLMAPPLQRRIERTSKATAGQFNVQVSTCRKLVLPLPPLGEQARIVAEVDRRLSIVREVEAEVDANLKRAQALRQAVLARAFAAPGESGQ
ncbi:MAG: restriction endonuclease subunit S [Burkholderiaceae bacterium]|nr:restriction endonuclease subunit S [Burkholderiaceae bacterium]